MRGFPAHFRSLLFMVMAFVLIVPAATSAAHNLTHGATGTIAAAHHHDTDAAASDKGQHAPAPDRHDGGHDHLLSAMPLAALFDETPLVHPPLPVTAPPTPRVATLALRPAEPPPADPPRRS